MLATSTHGRLYIAISLVLLFHSIYSKPTSTTEQDVDDSKNNNNDDDDEVLISKRTIGGIVDEINKRPTIRMALLDHLLHLRHQHPLLLHLIHPMVYLMMIR
jgi:hypothetical protein